MDNRSYLDNLNSGRHRRPQTSLDQLTRSLAKLEQQLDMRASQERPIYRQDRQRLADSAQYRGSPPQQAKAEPYAEPRMEKVRTRQNSDQLASELDALRQEMNVLLGESKSERAAHARSQADASDIKNEIERLTETVQGMARRTDDRAVNALRLELEQARATIEMLAREETVRSMGQRWEEFEARMISRQNGDGDYAALASRIDDMHAALDRLPEQLPLRAIDDKFRTLSSAVESLIHQNSNMMQDDEPLRRLEMRMEEIAATIQAASNAPAAFDDASLTRLERRLDEISRSIANTGMHTHDSAGIDRLETRIAGLSRQIEEQIARPMANPSLDQDRFVDVIEARLDELQARFVSDVPNKALQNIENRLDTLASRMEQSHRAQPAIDPLTVSNLEAQIANLSSYLSRPDPVGLGDEVAPRLDRLERSIEENRDLIMSAASQAADEAVRRMEGLKGGDVEAAAGLAADLQELESLTRRSDERNSKTFEAIHDTLLKIVDRLGTLEQGDSMPSGENVRRSVVTPPIAPDDELESVEAFAPVMERKSLTPAQAAAAAAAASLGEESGEPIARRSMLGGLARKLTRKQADAEPTALSGSSRGNDAPSVELDAPLDRKAVNRPLEPGSGAPDLSAIMKRVRDERAVPGRADATDAAKADLIAHARRAAQAAAAEAQTLKARSADGSTGKKGLLDRLGARRKPILMAAVAVMIALAGIQLSRSLNSEPASVATIEPSESSAMASAVQPTEPEEDAFAPATDDNVRVAESNVMQPQTQAMDEGPDVPLTESEAAEYAAPSPGDAPASSPVMPTASAALEQIPVDAGPIPLREAAAGGDSKALFEIGARYSDGRGVKADMKEAAQWYEKAADLGFAPAQYRIGNFYEKGTGVERDIKKAKTWYQLAANQGNASAMHNLAVLFAMGSDGTPDNESAARWFTQAADFGVKDSQFNLGILAAKGLGMPQSLEQSYKWFALVAKTGDRDAASKRDEIAKSLRPEQLERMRAEVELWRAKEPDAEANTVDIPESWQESSAETAGIDMKKAIRNVQGILNKNGYDAGPADGVMGERTKVAIKSFQSDNGLEPSGNVDTALVSALLAKN